ncbi:speckle-type POZ protein-like [Bombyx mandarina]|uniref:BTB domain-containing protein n=2 Tax=Bombyx TaxID=7090 RepID=A0A8R1WHS2_BOMMO|nr:speckle-type POZ protein-like [Bombyx mori]XP_028028334.1 speckle-type POZ protein-like [Bombyx mandarina]XP_028028335.1 speckle-type POZ protein-like [Bombyx mandarina]XP_037871388.1 speckle-type POZ protein-like [Bombyx mori]
MSSTNYTTRTEGQTKICTIIWTIPTFVNLLENVTKREFRVEKAKDPKTEFTHSKFQLKMQFLGRYNDIIEISYLSPNPVFLKSILTICLKRFEERTIVIKEYHTVQANKWQYLATLFKRDIASYDGRDIFLLSDGSLRLKVQFMVTNDIKIDRSTVPEAQLSNDLENLLNDGLFSDVIIKSAEGIEFKVHKAVLASRSAVLKAHFEHNTTECYTNVIESLLESTVLQEVLTFIYSDKAPRVDDIPEKLLAAADYYQLNRLKSLCEEALHKKLTVENAIETLQLADLHSANTLKQLTLEFIKDGQAKLITKTEGWAQVKSVDLIKRIYEYIMADDFDADIK